MKIILAIAAASAALSPQLPLFSFGPHRAGSEYTSASIASLDCEKDGRSIVCMDNSAIVAGSWAVVQIIITNRKLSQLEIAGDRESLPAVAKAMYSKYGDPCETGTETLVNGLGNAFPSKTATWCFQTGKMVLHYTGLRMSAYKAVYIDEANPPSD